MIKGSIQVEDETIVDICPTSDTSSFCSYDIQNKSVGKFLIFLGPDSENSPVKESWNTFRITWRQPPALPSEIPLLLEKNVP